MPLLYLPLIFRSLSLYYYAVCGRMCMSSVRVWCSVAACVCHMCVFGVLVCWRSACFTSRSPTDKNTKHAQMTYTCGHILRINPLNAELNPICHLLALLRAHPILHVSRIRVNTNSTNAKSAGEIVTAQSTAEDPLKMVEKKRPKHVGVLYLQTSF